MNHKCLVHLEVPFWIDYDYQPFERATLEYPGCSEGIELNDIEIPDDLKEYIQEKFTDQIVEECLEDYKDRNRGRY